MAALHNTITGPGGPPAVLLTSRFSTDHLGPQYCWAADHHLLVQGALPGSTQAHLRWHSSRVTALCAGPGVLVSGDEAGAVAVWAAEGGSRPQLVASLPAAAEAPVVALQLLQLRRCQLLLVLHAAVQQEAAGQQLAVWCVAGCGSCSTPCLSGEPPAGPQLAGWVQLPGGQLQPLTSLAAHAWCAGGDGGGTVGVEVMATSPEQVVFAELHLSYTGCSGEGGTAHRGSAEGAPAHPAPISALSLLQSRAYCPAVRTPTFRQRLAPFTASAILPETGQAFTATASGQAVLWGYAGELLPSALPTTATPRSTLPIAAANRQALQLVRLHDSAAVTCLAAAGALLVTGGADGTVRVFDGRLRIVAWCEDPPLTSGVAAISVAPAPSSVGGPAEAAPPDLLVKTASGKVVALPSAAFQLAAPPPFMEAGRSTPSSVRSSSSSTAAASGPRRPSASTQRAAGSSSSSSGGDGGGGGLGSAGSSTPQLGRLRLTAALGSDGTPDLRLPSPRALANVLIRTTPRRQGPAPPTPRLAMPRAPAPQAHGLAAPVCHSSPQQPSPPAAAAAAGSAAGTFPPGRPLVLQEPLPRHVAACLCHPQRAQQLLVLGACGELQLRELPSSRLLATSQLFPRAPSARGPALGGQSQALPGGSGADRGRGNGSSASSPAGSGQAHGCTRRRGSIIGSKLEQQAGEVQQQRQQQQQQQQAPTCSAALVTRDGACLVVGRSDGSMHFVDLELLSVAQRVQHTRSAVRLVAAAAHGLLLGVASAAGEILLYRRQELGGGGTAWALAGRTPPSAPGSQPLVALVFGEDPSGDTRLFALGLGGGITEFSLEPTDGSGWLTAASHACILDTASAHSSGGDSSAARSDNSAALEQVQQPRATALCFAPPLPYFHRGCDATLLLVASSDCTLTVWDADARCAVARVAHASTAPQPLAALLTFRAGRAVPQGQATAEPPASPPASTAAEGAEFSASRPPPQLGQPQAWVAFAGCGATGGSSVGVLPWPLPEGCSELEPAGALPMGPAALHAAISADAAWLVVCGSGSSGGGGSCSACAPSAGVAAGVGDEGNGSHCSPPVVSVFALG